MTGIRALCTLGISQAILGVAFDKTAQAQRPDTVWVNTRSGVYHCRGMRDYGRTSRGRYLLESEARTLGHRPNGGRSCPPSGPVVAPDVVNSARPLASGPFASVREGSPQQPAASTLTSCTVNRIADGDTIDCPPVGRVRLIGIDAPEGDQEPFATAATTALAAMIPPGALVLLERDAERSDRYGRALAYAWHEGRMVNWLMVRYGWAVTLRYAPNTRHALSFDAAVERARLESRGLWHLDGFRCPPKTHRDGRC